MVQFMKAMRDEKGEMVRNAHLLGFFRRICKLLYLKTKPVFVFDGATPVLKRRTVIARRRQRENAQAKIRKTAEKLLLNQLKQMRLKELAKDLEKQRKMQKKNVKGKKVSFDKPYDADIAGCNADVEFTNSDHVKRKEKSEMPNPAEDGGCNENEDEGEDEEIILPEIDGNIDPDVLAALPQSMQRQLLSQSDGKGKKIFSTDLDQSNMERSNAERYGMSSSSYNQEQLDEMLAASLTEQDDSKLANNASTSDAAIPSEDDSDADEEMILPAMDGNVDPAVLAALPPSLQLDLLVQMRERLMAENRQKYQKVKKAPEKFSELQIQSYLKTVAFRREIDQVQRAAAGRGVAGVQTSRIASEANREFIFSSSFIGDKQALTSSRKERDEDKQQELHSNHPSGSLSSANSICKSTVVTEPVPNELTSAPDEDVGTYLDERGRVRVSRLRGMGIRMTRDLQRNLDLMKEIEQERINSNKEANVQSASDRNRIGTSESLSAENQFVETSQVNCESVNLNESNQQSVFNNEACLEITFEDDGRSKFSDDDDDDIFARLAAGDPVTLSTADSGSDCEWEEATIGGKWDSVVHGMNAENNPSNQESNIGDESEVEWEEEPSAAPNSSSGPVQSGRMLSKGYLEEEADLQEAIRRSLTDLGVEKSKYFPFEVDKSKSFEENMDEGFGSLHEKNNMDGSSFPMDNVNQQNKSCENIDRVQKLYSVDELSISEAFNSPERLSPITHNSVKNSTLLNKPCERSDVLHSEQSRLNASTESVTTLETKTHFPGGKHLDASNEVDELSTVSNSRSKNSSHNLDAVGDLPGAILVDEKNDSKGEASTWISDKKSELCIMVKNKKNDFQSKPLHQSTEIVDSSILPMQSSVDKATSHIHIEQDKNCINEAEKDTDMSIIKGNDSTEEEFTQACLDEELLILGEEGMNLGDEQRKLERNAESVSSEMFAECQELLQMFGLPYIIAPMEAEAQCAYMELTNLVDGVVTDDSDVFLFGARSVYKNIFDDRKYVETYFMQDIEKELGLTREKLIRMALLLGSDYTEGVSGIGIVNAIEVVNAFPEEDGLHKFREWIESPDPTILGKFNVREGSSARKIEPKFADKDVNSAKTSQRDSVSSMEGASSFDQSIYQADENKHSTDCIDEIKQIFMDKHRNVSKNWHIPSSFPSEAVISAYSSPQVDESTEPFTLGRPDLFVLRKLCWEKFGWGSQKSDELLLPVLREYEKRETQLRLEAFYTFNERFAKIRSKRIKKAVKGITGNQSSELTDDPVQQVSKSKKKRRGSPVQSEDNKSGEPSNKNEDIGSQRQRKSLEKSVPRPPRKRQNPGKHAASEMSTPEPPLHPACRQKATKQSPGNGRGRGNSGGRKRRKANPDFEQSDTSSSAGNSGHDVDGEKLDQPQVVRRSTRTRNPVNYAVNDLEDEVCLSNKQSSLEEATEQEAADNLNEKNPAKVQDPSLEEDFDRECLERGGGFCIHETETDQPDASQHVDPSSEAETSKDYLKMGGGFCIEESETINDLNAAYHQDPNGATDSSNCFAFIDKADENIGSVKPSSSTERSSDGLQNGGKTAKPIAELNLDHRNEGNEDDSVEIAALQEATITDTEATFVGGLSAMPTLKRKRRKM
ncbi:hypothetical protein DITRI_Ditri09bG0030800 [Diplodiscus trichospermus]